MKPTVDKIKIEIRRMEKFLKEPNLSPITSRMVYAMKELLRWTIEDTKDWGTPLRQALDNATILNKEVLS